MPQELFTNFHSASSSCFLVGNWQLVMATDTPGDPQAQRWPWWHSADTALLSTALVSFLVSQTQTQSELVPAWLSLIENFPGHFQLLGTFQFTLIYYYIFKDTEM